MLDEDDYGFSSTTASPPTLTSQWQIIVQTFTQSSRSPVVAIRCHPQVPMYSVATFGSGNENASLSLFELSTDRRVFSYRLRIGSLWSSEFHPRDERACTIALGLSRSAALLDRVRFNARYFYSDKSDVFALAFDADGRWLFSGARDGCVRTVDLRAPTESADEHGASSRFGRSQRGGSHTPLLAHSSSVSCVRVLADQHYLLCCATDGTLYRWDRRMDRSPVLTFGERTAWNSAEFEFSLSRFALDADERRVFVATGSTRSSMRTALIYDIDTGQRLDSIGPFQQPVKDLVVQSSWADRRAQRQRRQLCLAVDRDSIKAYEC
jgi:WD40 repeat protein